MRVWAIRTNRDHRHLLLGELEAGRLRQGWGWLPSQDLRSIRKKVLERAPLSEEEQQSWRSKRMLPEEGGIRAGDLLVLPNLPGDRQFLLAEVVGDYRFQRYGDGGEPVEDENTRDYGHILPVKLPLGMKPWTYDHPAVGAGLRASLRNQSRMWNLDPRLDEVQSLLRGGGADRAAVSPPAPTRASPPPARPASPPSRPAVVVPQGALPVLPDRFQVLRLLGRGGMGQVYLCRDLELDVEVAIKVLPAEIAAEEDAVARVRDEARAAARLRDCPGIVALYGFEKYGDTCYLVMQYAPGGTLQGRLRGRAALPESATARIGATLARSLHEAHRRKVLHRDIKPANILFDAEDRPLIADFGIAKVFADISAKHSLMTIVGTPVYMPPEALLRKAADGRSDLYSLGCTLYEMATGTPPFEGSLPEIALAKVAPGAKSPDPREIRPGLSPEFSRIVVRLLEQDSGRRHPDGEALARDLDALPRGTASIARPVSGDDTVRHGTPILDSLPKGAPSPQDPLIGAEISKCTILEKLGEGGAGTVYRAQDQLLGRAVAMKFLHPSLTSDASFTERFIKEAITAAQSKHPSLVMIHKLGRDESRDLHYIVTEFLEGGTLARRVRERGPLPPTEAIPLFLKVAEAISTVHGRGIVHGNLRPENLLFDAAGALRVTVFALPRIVQIDMNPIREDLAPYCLSPEQFQGRAIDRRTDVYSLGVTLYFALSGKFPFPGATTMDCMYALLRSNAGPLPQIAPAVPGSLWSIVSRMMAKEPKDRFADLKATAGALGEAFPQ